MNEAGSNLARILEKFSSDILEEWLGSQLALAPVAAQEKELRTRSREFIASLQTALPRGLNPEAGGPEWTAVREQLGDLSRRRALQGFTPTQTAMFVFSLKQPLFARLRGEYERQPKTLAEELWNATAVLDKLGLYTMEVYQQNRETVIKRQQEELLELSTPVVQLWKGVLALPLIGTLDSARTQVVMESLLQSIVSTGSAIAIIDITGVPTVDTLVAQHLLKTVAAARLMGADCIISGIRPQIAQTIVHLGVDLKDVITKATLADAFVVALQRTGSSIERPDA